jgi:hypothetical protein
MSDSNANQLDHLHHPAISGIPTAGAEERVDQLVAEIGAVIRTAEPTRQAELSELAETLIHEEVSTIPVQSQQAASTPSRHGFNPLPLGILLIALSVGLFIIVPLLGLILAVMGVVLAVWGAIMSWRGK